MDAKLLKSQTSRAYNFSAMIVNFHCNFQNFNISLCIIFFTFSKNYELKFISPMFGVFIKNGKKHVDKYFQMTK